MLKEFRDFVTRGNILDLAVAVILASAFGKVIASLVTDIIMPPIGLLLGGVAFNELYWNISGEEYESLAAAQEAGAATINYGLFIDTIILFLIIAFVVFLILRAVNKKAKAAAAAASPPEPTAKEKLLTEIRDLLARR